MRITEAGRRTASCHMQSVAVQAARRAIGNNQLIRFHFVSWGSAGLPTRKSTCDRGPFLEAVAGKLSGQHP
jgi:hypothetical protein